ncbi:MAG: hypothetical protein WCI27_10690, partial [Candidatus Omnitrophota bacterium]
PYDPAHGLVGTGLSMAIGESRRYFDGTAGRAHLTETLPSNLETGASTESFHISLARVDIFVYFPPQFRPHVIGELTHNPLRFIHLK